MRSYPVMIFLLLLISMPIMHSPVVSQQPSATLVDNKYRFEIIAQRFNFTIIDLNHVDQLMNNGMSNSTARNQSILGDNISGLKQNSQLEITIYSIDVLHGIIISRLGLSAELPAPINGTPVIKSLQTTLPEADMVINAFCNIYCGVDHDQMQFKLTIGDGNPESFSILGLDLISLGWFALMIVFGLGVVIIAVMDPINIFSSSENDAPDKQSTQNNSSKTMEENQ